MTRCISLLVVAACGSGSPGQPDAPKIADADVHAIDAPAPGDALPDALACVGQPAPTTAPDPITIAGTVVAVDHYQISPVANATVTVHRTDNGTILQLTSGADGKVMGTLPSGGAVVDTYMTVTAGGFRTTRFEPGAPIAGVTDQLFVVATDAELARWYGDAGTAQTSSALIAAVVDCNGQVLGGTTIAPSPTSAVTYYDDSIPKWNPALAASSNGYALVSAPSTSTTITAHTSSITFPPHAFSAPANELVLALVRPRT